MNNHVTTNDSNSDDLIENNSSQELKHIVKSVVAASRNTSGSEKKVKKLYCKKYRTLTHHQQKLGMEDYGNSRKFHGTIMSVEMEKWIKYFIRWHVS